MEDLKKLENLSYKPEGVPRRFICQCGDVCKASIPPATLGFNTHDIRPETRVNKAEDAGQPLEPQTHCPKCGQEWKKITEPNSQT